jgi:predicted DNA-binding protein
MPDRQLLKSYLPSELRKRVRQYAAKKGVSESAVTTAAIVRYLEDLNDVPLILRKLHRIDRELGRVRRDGDMLAEAFAVFVQLWFAHTPRLAEQEKPAAEQSALQRFSEFVEHVAEKLGTSGSLAAELRRPAPAEDGEGA